MGRFRAGQIAALLAIGLSMGKPDWYYDDSVQIGTDFADEVDYTAAKPLHTT